MIHKNNFFLKHASYSSLVKFGNTYEKVYKKVNYPKEEIQHFFKDDVISVIGYGPQGRSQALNMRDNGLNVNIGVRNFDSPTVDGFVKGKDLFSIEEAVDRSTITLFLLSDAGQKATWKNIKPYLTGKTLCFSHGFGIVYNEQTGIVPDDRTNVILVAPKGTGKTLRDKFLMGKGVNSSIAVHRDYNGMASYTAQYIGFGIGSGYLYDTTFEKEVYSDLVGERGILMGAIHGLFLAQYKILREMGHSPSEAFNETVEEATQSLYPLIGEQGMDWMYANCSTTAQRGAIDWYPKFEKAVEPVFRELYKSVRDGEETRIVLEKNNDPEYRTKLNNELAEIANMEIWQAGATVRKLR
jgi:ketol-acid reductoisomerase